MHVSLLFALALSTQAIAGFHGLTVSAVRPSYALTQASSETITATVTPTVRWDLVKFVQQTVLAGGADVGKDQASHDTITLRGTGDARPGENSAAGGGTFVLHRHGHGGRHDDHWADDEVHGIYVVTGFMSWQPAAGALAVNDGIGRASEASAGVLTVSVRLYPAGGGHQDGVLTVNARLPGETFDVQEGITLGVNGFHFVQDGGAALFHIEP